MYRIWLFSLFPDLPLLRSITIEERGDDKDLDDFVDLMRLARQMGARFGFLTEEQIKRIVGVAMLVGTEKGVDPSDIMPLLSVWMRGGVLRGRLDDNHNAMVTMQWSRYNGHDVSDLSDVHRTS